MTNLSKTYFNGKVIAEVLEHLVPPVNFENYRVLRLTDPRGEFCVFLRDQVISFGEYVQFNQGTVRGNHYHSLAHELVYVTAGKLKCLVEDIKTKERVQIQLETGSRVHIMPNIAHAFYALEPSSAILLASEADPIQDRTSYALTFELEN